MIDQSQAAERTLFSDSNALVSTTRIILNGTTYPLSNVSSVRLLTKKANHLFTVFAFLVGVVALAAQSWVFGLVCLAIGFALAYGLKAQHTLLIGTAGGEHSALMSRDRIYIQGLVTAINEAVIARG